MTRQEQLEHCLLSVASHGRVLLSLAEVDLLTPAVIASSAALFDAAAELAVRTVVDDAPAAPSACEHPAEQRVEFGGMGESDGFQCKACGAHVAPVPVGTGAPGC